LISKWKANTEIVYNSTDQEFAKREIQELPLRDFCSKFFVLFR